MQFYFSTNKVLFQTAIATVENDNFQYCTRLLLDNGSQSSYITPKLCGKLHLKSIASRDITIKVFGHQVLHKETIDCVEYV